MATEVAPGGAKTFPCAKEAPHYRVARLAGKVIVAIFLTI